MNEESIREWALEDEQQTAVPRLGYSFELQRREFFKLLGGGVLVCMCIRPALGQESGGGRRPGGGEELPKSIAGWLHVGEDGMVTVYTGKAELGQIANCKERCRRASHSTENQSIANQSIATNFTQTGEGTSSTWPVGVKCPVCGSTRKTTMLLEAWLAANR